MLSEGIAVALLFKSLLIQMLSKFIQCNLQREDEPFQKMISSVLNGCDTNKIYMSKRKFLVTNRDHFSIRKVERVSQEIKQQKKSPDNHKELLLPIEITTRSKQWHGKPMRSEGKSSQRQTKMPTFELLNLKESLLLKPQRETFNIKNIGKKRMSTNRIETEKVTHPSHSVERKTSINKILIRGGGYNKEHSPERNDYFGQELNKISASSKITQPEGPFFTQSPRKSLEKKLTPFEKDEIKYYQIFFIGSRRIASIQDFTDSQGDPKALVGDSIAYKYEIISILGRGSFGKVFKAYDHKKRQYIALKIIKNQEKFNTQAKVEIQILQTAILHDPKLRCNIVRLKGSFVFRGHTCLKFEILNKNLYQFIKETNFVGFSLDLIRRFAIQMLQALHFFYKHKIIHCDLKPQNVLLKEENKSGIKVIDVGSGCFDGKQIYTYIQSRFYRAPQIILGIKYTTAIDMWSLGCILVQLYTGIPVFPGQNENQQMLMFIELLGMPPRGMLERAERRKKFFTDTFECKIPMDKHRQKFKNSMNWKTIMGSDCDRSFLSLIKGCLHWSPEERLTPKQALLHEWVISGLPHTIRSQHVQQLSHQ